MGHVHVERCPFSRFFYFGIMLRGYFASCIISFLDKEEIKSKQYGMLVGTSDFTNTSRYLNIYGAFQYRQIVSFHFHPSYEDPKAYYDVAIAHAKRPIEFNDYINAICLPFYPDENINAKTSMTMAGFDFNMKTLWLGKILF